MNTYQITYSKVTGHDPVPSEHTVEIKGSSEEDAIKSFKEYYSYNTTIISVKCSCYDFDSSKDTLLHIKRVSELLTIFATEMLRRGTIHDNSKLQSPEKELFDQLTPKLANSTYGSPEYKGFLEELKVALSHHYENNSHHPEYYKNGVDDMDLFDLVEMAFDWKAATERHKDGDIFKSIEINRERFKLNDQLASILRNTFIRMQKTI